MVKHLFDGGDKLAPEVTFSNTEEVHVKCHKSQISKGQSGGAGEKRNNGCKMHKIKADFSRENK